MADPRFPRVFLLSPALASGRRSLMLMREEADFDLARRLRQGTTTVAEIYAFISGLYFRGKVAYSQAFGVAPEGLEASRVIVPGFGLVPPDWLLTLERLKALADVAVDHDNSAFSEPLLRDAHLLNQQAGSDCRFILLGSIASDKYTLPLLSVFGERLLFPTEFVGRGDMSRGGLMLRCAESIEELSYSPIQGAIRRGSRPPKLQPKRREAIRP